MRLLRYAGRLATRPNEVEIAGLKIAVPPGADGPVRAILYAELYEGLERRALPILLRPEDRVVEAGAAIGFIGLCCARIVGPQNLLLTEANKDLVLEIERNFAANGFERPRILQALAAAQDGPPEAFHVAEQFWSSSALDRGATRRVDRVQRANLNTLFRSFEATVFICDIEGGEFALLPGLDFTGVRLVVAELHRKLAKPGEVERARASIEAQGFRLAQCFKDEVFIFERLQTA